MPRPHLAWARKLGRALKYAPDRALHPSRRRTARERIGTLESGPLLVLCFGNICRSPYAEAVLRREMARMGHPTPVESAGFILPGREPPGAALEVSADRGLDLSGHRSRVVTEDMVRKARIILVMDPSQKRKLLSRVGDVEAHVMLLGDFDPGPIDRRSIPDPIDQPREVFERVFARIDACCADLVTRLKPADPGRV